MAPGAERTCVKFFLDEMLPPRVAVQLRRRGHDVASIAERPEWRGLGDPELFERAQSEGRAVVTSNRDDFLALDREYLSRRRGHHGIVILHPRRFPQGPAGEAPLIASLAAFLVIGPPHAGFVHWLQKTDAP